MAEATMARKATRPGYQRYFDINGWFFVSSAIALIGVFMAYPIVKSLWLSEVG